MSNKVLGIVTARYASTRFPGKPLVDIGGLPMVHRTYNQAKKANFDHVVVATDDARIRKYCYDNKIHFCMTSSKPESGTERCAEVWDKTMFEPEANGYKYIVNIQGDEPFVAPETLNLVINRLKASNGNSDPIIVTPIMEILDKELAKDPGTVKVVIDKSGYAMYFSRSPIPFDRDGDAHFWYWKHLGVYGYDINTLMRVAALPKIRYSEVEKLEQLKWLEHGYRIATVETDHDSDGIDTPEDLERVIKKYGL